MKRTIVLLGTTALILGACSQTVTPADVAKATYERQVDAVESAIDEAPEWFTDLPSSDSAVYSSGTATSRDFQLAIDMAVLNAKRVLADRVDGKLNSMTKEYTTRVGDVDSGSLVSEIERATKNVITSTNVAGYRVKQSVVHRDGRRFRAYVLLEYPMGEANKMMARKLGKQRQKQAHRRGKKAFKELDREIEADREERRHQEDLNAD